MIIRDQPAQDAKFISELAKELKRKHQMGADTETSNEWNIRTLKEHVETVLREQDRRFEQRFEAQEKALQTALSAKEYDASKNRSNVAMLVSVVAAGIAAAAGLGALMMHR